MTFDRFASFRRIKPQRRAPRLIHRADADLPLVGGTPSTRRDLLLDTCVYIDLIQGKLPIPAKQLLASKILNHSTVALAELTHLFGALDPAHPGTTGVLKALSETVDDIREHRLAAPSARACGEAGMLAGLVTRLTGQRNTVALLNDAILFLQAAEIGCDLLTGNVSEFDWFDQLIPGSGVLLYR